MMNRWTYRRMPKLRLGDNDSRRYELDPKRAYEFSHARNSEHGTFEQFLANAVREAHKAWLNDPICVDIDWNPMFNEDGTPVLENTIWDSIALPDSKFYKRHHYNWRVRVPKMNRSDREWLNFYVTFPWIAASVITGKERYSNGAKLKWIPLFTKILEKEWPKENQYNITEDQLKQGLEQANFYKMENDAYKNIGKKVKKFSGKPFKSHLWINTIKGVDYMEVPTKDKKSTIKRVCYTFEEDDSMVSVEMCEVIK